MKSIKQLLRLPERVTTRKQLCFLETRGVGRRSCGSQLFSHNHQAIREPQQEAMLLGTIARNHLDQIRKCHRHTPARPLLLTLPPTWPAQLERVDDREAKRRGGKSGIWKMIFMEGNEVLEQETHAEGRNHLTNQTLLLGKYGVLSN